MKRFILFAVFVFSFMSIAEEKYKTGLIIPKDWKAKAKFESSLTRTFALPSEFDWRTQKTLSPVMNQGSCGSCWAFSASATFRDNMIVQMGQNFTNSTQQVLDCNQQGYSCNGGFFDVDDFFVNPGVASESAYGPYVAKKNSCKSGIPVEASASGWTYVAQANGAPSDAEIKAAIYQWGPVSVGVAADTNFQKYTGGIFTNCTAKQLNHAVQLVGWNDNGNPGYWIMRNSWGGSWGESGYIRIKYGCNGIGEAANYFKFSDSPQPTPTPTPGPTPTPPPCNPPTASTGHDEYMQGVIGERYLMGVKAEVGVKYSWVAEPAFTNNAKPTTAQIYYKPIMTKKLTVTATNKCGSSSAFTTIDVDDLSKKIKTYR